jgi:hypothetical protein
MGYYWIRYLGSLFIWLFTGFKEPFSKIEGNNRYSFYVGLAFIIFIVLLTTLS